MMPVLGASCRTALKEWATVLEAMARGEQLVLIRKGGLIEPGGGFELASPVFVCYPTFEHQAVQFLRVPYQRYFEEASARRAPEGKVRIELAARAEWLVRSTDPAVVKRLEAVHIYNEAFVQQRLKWQPEQPLAIAAVRVFRLAAPQVLPVAGSYAGCKSWVELDSPLSLEGAQPVLADAVFDRALGEIQVALG